MYKRQDDDSLMVIKNCHNAGSISKESGESGVVSVPEFIESRASSDKGINLNSIESLTSDMVGGIVGVNLPKHVIDGCSNSGNLSGFTGLGGVVGLNMGRIFDCSLTENFGNAGLSYIGGIAGINVNANNKNLWTYTTTQSYKSKDCQGTIKYCTTKAGKTISGKKCVGGITGDVYKRQGSMFWVRTKALKGLFAHDWEYDEFPKEPIETDATVLHALERLYPFCVQNEGSYSCLL